MLKRVALKVAIPQISSNETITSERIKPKGKKSFTEISGIIENNINIQIALAELIHLSTDYVHNIGFLNERRIEDEISNISGLFKYAELVCANGDLCCMQVSEPNKDSLCAYQLLLQENKLNEFVMHFMGRNIDYCNNEISCYELLFDSPSFRQLDTNNLSDNVFFNYFRHNKRNLITNKCLPLLGFSFHNIENDPFLFSFSRLVKSMFMYVNDLNYPYTKFITWHENDNT